MFFAMATVGCSQEDGVFTEVTVKVPEGVVAEEFDSYQEYGPNEESDYQDWTVMTYKSEKPFEIGVLTQEGKVVSLENIVAEQFSCMEDFFQKKDI